MLTRFCAVALGAALCAASADAAYVLTPLVGGSSGATVSPGTPFNLDVAIASTASDTHDSCLFRLEFSAENIGYLGYVWASPYTTGTIFDDSFPTLATLPQPLTNGLLTGFGYPSNTADVEFSNVLLSGSFTAGTLVTLTLMIPAWWSGPDSINVRAIPDTFARGFDEVPTAPGSPLKLSIVPAPHTIFALSLALPIMTRRRRSRTSF